MSFTSCPFDPSHKIQADKLLKHIYKCKSPNKTDFQQCKYNQLHWVNFQKIKQHQQQCGRQNYSSVDDSVIEGLVNAMEERDPRRLGSFDIKKGGQKKKKKVQQQKQEDDGLWKEPSFKAWLEKNYKRNQKIVNFSHLGSSLIEGDSESFSGLDFKEV